MLIPVLSIIMILHIPVNIDRTAKDDISPMQSK
nr:MAG TPA: hypothetical protein [Siphoviridae sp. ctDlU28]